MGRFLDQRSSMNAGAPIDVALTAPVLFGTVGLQTQNVANPIVDLNGTIGLEKTAGGTAVVQVNVVRGTTLTDPIIFTALITMPAGQDVRQVPFLAQDLNAPAALQTVYSSIASLISTTGGTTVSRVGPETFWGLASASV